MNFTDHTSDDYTMLLGKISRIFAEKGLKATTMDLVASRLQMSKRTLYEIFENKNEMILEVINFNQEEHRRYIDTVFRSTGNVMEGLLAVFKSQQRHMRNVNADFFRDLDSYYRELRPDYDRRDRALNRDLQKVIAVGIKQGVFREDVNYPVVMALMRLQMESLKRMEEHFPPEITLQEAFDVICVGFFRSIASAQGMRIIDEALNNDECISSLLSESPDSVLNDSAPHSTDSTGVAE